MMSDRIQQVLVYVMAMAMIAAVAAAPTVAQTTDPSAERVFEVAGLNADKVDGRHAVAYTTNRTIRASKLVATNANGYLPSNIVKPQWSVIQNKPAGFADGKDNKGVTKAKLTIVKGPRSDVPAGTNRYAYATCPSGSYATGGGFSQDLTGLQILHSLPLSGNKWQVRARNVGSYTTPLYAFAVCMSTLPSWGMDFEG